MSKTLMHHGPNPNTWPEQEVDPVAEPIGYLFRGPNEPGLRIICPTCKPILSNHYLNAQNIGAPVYAVNFGAYRQTCRSCDRVIRVGEPGWCELFDGKT